jgi:hypothetical protein
MTAPKEIWITLNRKTGRLIHTWLDFPEGHQESSDHKYILATHTHTPEYLSSLPAEVLEKAGWVKKEDTDRIARKLFDSMAKASNLINIPASTKETPQNIEETIQLIRAIRNLHPDGVPMRSKLGEAIRCLNQFKKSLTNSQ